MWNLRIAAKGSRKVKDEFCDETKFLSSIVKIIEIDFNYPHDNNFEVELKFLKKLSSEKGISYTVHAQYLSGGLNDVNYKIRQESLKQVFQAIKLASYLGAPIVTMHPALEPYGLKIPDSLSWEIENYKEIGRYAEKKKILIGFENEAQTCFWFPDRACKISRLIKTVEAVNLKNFGYTLDIGHANVSGEDYLSAIEKMGDKLFHIHAHDNFGAPAINLERCGRVDPHLPLGQGEINWQGVLKKLKKINYQNCLELENEIQDIGKSLEYLKALE